jgi:RimJ/RimL family protein N-acetyltransferase
VRCVRLRGDRWRQHGSSALASAPYGARGYGTETVRLICDCGFFFRSLHNIEVEVNGYNRRAMKLYARLGFRTAGRIRGAIPLNGNPTIRSS